MADTNVITETAPHHPLQRNWLPGPKGAFELKVVEEGVYVRVDMPGVKPESVRVYKSAKDQEIAFQGLSPKVNDLPLDDSVRLYSGTIKIECENFEQVSVAKTVVNNGSCRTVISGAVNGSLVFRTKSESEPVKARTPASWHLQPDSILIEGIQNVVMHKKDCRCCKGQKADTDPSGPWSEEMGYINPFVLQGNKGVFETKFEPLIDGSGQYFMYFRLDMPDCAARFLKMDIKKEHIIVIGLRAPNDFYLDEVGGRKYFCKLMLNCRCCSFDHSSQDNMIQLLDGVLRMIVRIQGSNLTKDVPSAGLGERAWSDRATCDPSASLGECSTTESSATQSRRRRRRRRRGGQT